MLRATKDIMLPTTITGSLPRPSWYTQNLGSRSFLDAMVNNQFREQYVDAVSVLSPRAGNGRPRYRHRRRRAFRLRCRRPELDQLSAAPHGRLRQGSEADAGRQGRPGISARPHPARLSGIARDARHRRAGDARRAAICRHVQGGAAHDQEAGQVRHHRAGAGRLCCAGQALQINKGPYSCDHRCAQRGTARSCRRRLSGDPVRGAADPSAGGAQSSWTT